MTVDSEHSSVQNTIDYVLYMLHKGLLKYDQLRYSSYQKKDMYPTNISTKLKYRAINCPTKYEQKFNKCSHQYSTHLACTHKNTHMCTCTNTAATDINQKKKVSRIQLILQELTQLWNPKGLIFSETQSKNKALDILTTEISGGRGDIVIRGRVKYTLLAEWYNIY